MITSLSAERGKGTRGVNLACLAFILIAVLSISGGTAEAATFGNTDFASATTAGFGNTIENTVRGSKFTLTEDATVHSITAKFQNSIAVKSMKCMIYRASDSILFGVTEAIDVSVADPVEVTFDFEYIVNLAADDYWIVAWSASADGVAILYSEATGGTGNLDAQTYATTPQYTFSRDAADVSNNYAIYATYTAGTTPILGYNLGAGDAILEFEDVIRVGSGPSNVASESGTVDSLSALINTDAAVTDAPVTIVVYTYDSVLVGVSTERLITTSAAVRQWFHFAPSGTINITSGTGYLIGAWSDAVAGAVVSIVAASSSYGRTTADSAHGDAATYPTEPDPLVPTAFSGNRVQAYFVYSPLAADIPKRRRRILEMRRQGIWFIREALKTFAGGEDAITH